MGSQQEVDEAPAAALPAGGYGVDRVRLMVRDPRCLFAYWDVDPSSVEALRARHGERAVAVSPLTLRIDGESGTSLHLLLRDERSRYLPARPDQLYRAELGLTLPWGEFERLSASDPVMTPRSGPSPAPSARPVREPGSRWPSQDRRPPDPSHASARTDGDDAGCGGSSDSFEPSGAGRLRRG